MHALPGYKNYLAALLSLSMIFGSFSPTVLADNASDQNPIGSTTQSLESLFTLATHLSTEARSGNASATQFRIETVFYRESLRELMLAQEQSDTPLSKDLLMEFVRMSALLQSAAACRTGRYIVCPAPLMQQLNQQQQRLADKLQAL